MKHGTACRKTDAYEIKALLQARVMDLIRDLCPGFGYVSGKYYFPTNPTRADKRPGSMWIAIKGNAIGAWRDEAVGAKGDIIDLVTYCLGFAERKTTFAWVRDWLGIDQMSDADREAARRRHLKHQQDCERAETAEVSAQRRRAYAAWLRGAPLAGTLAEAYLKGRGIDLSRLTRPPGALRFAAGVRHTESGRELPAMLGLMTQYDADGSEAATCSLHRTFLAPDGRGKADVLPQKKIWPRGWMGAVIPIQRGAGNLSVKAACARGQTGTLCVTEGIEDALTIAMAEPDWRVWAVGTLGNFAHVTLPSCVGRLVVAADNDDGKRQAQDAFKRGLGHLTRQCRDVVVARAWGVKDFNGAVQLREQ